MRRLSGSRAVLALAYLAGCRTPGGPEGDSRRLGPDTFGIATTGWHGPVVQIGDDARAVLAAPELLAMADVSGVRVETEAVTVAVTLPPAARDLPDAAFTLPTATDRRIDLRASLV